MAEKTIPWWRRALKFALDGLRAVFSRGNRTAAHEPEPEAVEAVETAPPVAAREVPEAACAIPEPDVPQEEPQARPEPAEKAILVRTPKLEVEAELTQPFPESEALNAESPVEEAVSSEPVPVIFVPVTPEDGRAESESGPEPEPTAAAETEAEEAVASEAVPEPEPEPEPEAPAAVETAPEVTTEAEPEVMEGIPAEIAAEEEPAPAVEAGAAPETEPAAEPEIAEEAEPSAETEPTAEVEPAAEPGAAPEAADEVSAEIAAEVVAEPESAVLVSEMEPAELPVEPVPEPAEAEAAAHGESEAAPQTEVQAEIASVEEAQAAEPPSEEPVAEPLPETPAPEVQPQPEAEAAPPAAEAVPEPVPEPAIDQKAVARQEAIKKKIAESDPDSPFSILVGQVYDGPLDLLLDLIRKQDIDIYDIPIARITSQFLAYVDRLKATDVDVAGEFIYTASLLIHIKSKMLLPRTPTEEGEQAEDPRRELVERLLEHERFKNAAQMLQEKQMLEAASWSNPGVREFKHDQGTEPEIAADTVDLVRVFRVVLERARTRPVINVNEESVNVGQMIQFLTRRLTMEDKPVALRRLLSHTRSERALIAMFLALLELVRMQAILLRQDRAFSEIFIKKHEGFDALLESGVLQARDEWR